MTIHRDNGRGSAKGPEGSSNEQLSFASILELQQESPILALALTFPARGTPDATVIKEARAEIAKLRTEFSEEGGTSISAKRLEEIARMFIKGQGILSLSELGSIIVSLVTAKTLDDSISVSQDIEGCIISDQRSFYRTTLMRIAKSTEVASGHASAFQYIRFGGNADPGHTRTSE